MGVFTNGNNTAASQPGFNATVSGLSATYSGCFWFMQETVVVDLTDMWFFVTSGLIVTTDNTGVQTSWGDGVSSNSFGNVLVPGLWCFVGFSTDQSHVTIYTKQLGGRLLRVSTSLTNTAPPTQFTICGGTVNGANDSNPIGHFAEYRYWDNTIMSMADFENESRQLTPFRKPTFWWPLLNASDSIERTQATIEKGGIRCH